MGFYYWKELFEMREDIKVGRNIGGENEVVCLCWRRCVWVKGVVI